MNATAVMALYAWPVVVLGMFLALPARRAVVAAYIGAWLFLPMAGWDLPGFGEYSKVTATSFAVLGGIALFDVNRIFAFRPSWFDLPMLVWCTVPMASSISMVGQGAYDGASGIFSQAMVWGVPYFVGRIYFNDLEGLRELAVGIVVGGLIYVPLCLYEWRMSPQLHNIVYGFHQHSFAQTRRFDGWRPMVFMQHGLAVGFWMTSAALIAYWLWRSRAIRHVAGLSGGVTTVGLLVMTFMVRSMNAILLCAGGLGLLMMTRWTRTGVFMVCLLMVPPVYMAARGTGLWSGDQAVGIVENIDEGRAASLRTRLVSEDVYVSHAMERPFFGWGRWRDFRPPERIVDGFRVIPDGQWIIALAMHGVVGLVSLTGALLLPMVAYWRRYPLKTWMQPDVAPGAVLGVVLVLYMIDNLLNAMGNPIYVLAAGGLVGSSIYCVARPAGAMQVDVQSVSQLAHKGE